MTWHGRLTVEQARKLGVPDSSLVITPLQHLRPRKPQGGKKPSSQPETSSSEKSTGEGERK